MIRARKRFGQHFLEPAWVDKVIAAIDPTSDDTFIEIGPGRGALTVPLAKRARHVVAFEIDRDLAGQLRSMGPPNVTVIEGDVLDRLTAESLIPNPESLRVAGNLPYNVASPILFRLIDLFVAGCPLTDATVMLQREVADRLTATPGTKEYGVLSILIGQMADIDRVLALPPGAFRPMPKVRSAVVRLRFHPPDPQPQRPDLFRGLVKAIFTRRRKTLANALAAFAESGRIPPAKALEQSGLDGKRRPETLTISELVRLSDAYT